MLEKTVGSPLRFCQMRPRDDLPDTFDIADYLTIGSVINTLYSVFKVPKSHYRTHDQWRRRCPCPLRLGV